MHKGSPRYRIAHVGKMSLDLLNLETLKFLMHFREPENSLFLFLYHVYSYFFSFLLFFSYSYFCSFFIFLIYFLFFFLNFFYLLPLNYKTALSESRQRRAKTKSSTPDDLMPWSTGSVGLSDGRVEAIRDILVAGSSALDDPTHRRCIASEQLCQRISMAMCRGRGIG
jgi:hypothetical protein